MISAEATTPPTGRRDARAESRSDSRTVSHADSHRPWGPVAATVVAGYAVIGAVLIGAGLLIDRTLTDTGLVEWDRSTVRWFADHRTTTLDTMSKLWSRLADAPSIVAVGLLIAIVLAVRRQWFLVVMTGAILAVELLTFLTISYTVGRERPDVVHLGSVPSTGSFPSGHIAATIVLYGFLAYLLRRFGAPAPLVILAVVWTEVAAAAVGWARMYRGMHHPLDVIAGALMGIAVLVTFIAAIRPGSHPKQEELS